MSYATIAQVVDGTIAEVDPALVNTMGNDVLLLVGSGLLIMGLLFKVGAVPFHMWTPDVYQGAPTPVTGLMAAATKVAAFGALLRVLYVLLPGLRWDWRPVMWAVAIVTMLGGAIIAITQTDIKRLLAYSAISHAGFILAGVIATTPEGISSVLFYLAAYSFVTIGAFAVVTLVRDAGGEATHLSKWAGLGRRSPLVAAVFAVFLLAFAGIPLTSGFAGKFAVFKAAAEGGAVPLVVVGVIASAIAAFFYIRVIVLMFFSEPKPEGPTVAVPSPLTMMAIGMGVAVTVVLGVAPQYFLELAGTRECSCADPTPADDRTARHPLGGRRAVLSCLAVLGRAWPCLAVPGRDGAWSVVGGRGVGHGCSEGDRPVNVDAQR
ncbi:NADH-quinone oxidoreductase subunit NuoN [Streptomyces hirsutus]